MQQQRKYEAAERAERILPCRADVEKTRLEREGDRKTAHNERRRRHDFLADAGGHHVKAAEQNLLEAVGIRLVAAEQQQNQKTEQQTDCDADQTREQRHKAGGLQ